MFGHRTPLKTQSQHEMNEIRTSPLTQMSGELNDQLSHETTSTTSNLSFPRSSPADAQAGTSKSKKTSASLQGSGAAARGRRVQSEVLTSSPELKILKPIGRVSEAKACVMKAKLQINNSRNIKTEIKVEVIQAVNRLYQLVKEAEDAKLPNFVPAGAEEDKTTEKISRQKTVDKEIHSALSKKLEDHAKLLLENTESLRKLQQHIEKRGQEHSPETYASVAAMSASRPVHSMVVSSTESKDTSDDIIGKIRTAVNAKTCGIRVDRLRKARDGKVVLGCQSKEELRKIAQKIQIGQPALIIEQKENKDPLVILKNVLTVNTDDDIIAALWKQNNHILGGIADADYRTEVRYRKHARNPRESHVVLRVSPRVWQSLTSAGRVHVDLQRVLVFDQSPLLQCSKCLAYGHGRKSCTEVEDLCSHCSGKHMRKDCPQWRAGDLPKCQNCTLAKLEKRDHNSFDNDCPIRKNWEKRVRSNVAYC